MTDFAVTGKKRSGKGLFCAGLARDALKAGRRVVTNMDLFPEKFLPPTSRATYLRIPDTPTVADMQVIGIGYEGDDIDEDRNGLIILDECSRFFNARQWGDKTRQPLLDWLIHSGKLRWDVYYQMQGLSQIDKQVRDTQVEYHVAVKNTKKWPIPFLTPLASMIGIKLQFPKVHLGIIKQGCDMHALTVERKWYKAKELYAAYDTEQRFLERDHPDAVGIHTVLSPWLTRGRYLPPPPNLLVRLYRAFRGRPIYDQPVTKTQPVKHPLVVELSNLPELDAIREFQRLECSGAFN